MTLIPPDLLADLERILEIAKKSVEYEALLRQAAALPKSPVFVCQRCGKFAVRERAHRKFCKECGR